MKTSIIVACDPNGIIGINNTLPFDIPADLQRFRELTEGNAVIMGRKTFESIGRVLPKRLNIVITSVANAPLWALADKGFSVLRSLAESLMFASEIADKQHAFIIGGERLYEEALPIVDSIYLTLVDAPVQINDGDSVARFPYQKLLDDGSFILESVEKHEGYSFINYVRR